MRITLVIMLALFFGGCYQKNNNISNKDCTEKDSVYDKVLKQKVALSLNRPPSVDDVNVFMKNRTYDDFENLCQKFINADLLFEEMIYALVAVDKFNISKGYYQLAFCLTDGFSNSKVSQHSYEMASHYLSIGTKTGDDSSKNGQKTLKHIAENKELLKPGISDKNSILNLKHNTLSGSISDYKELKKQLYDNNQHATLFYYAFIIADRFGYDQAKQDLLHILSVFYKDNYLGDLGVEAVYFCDIIRRS